MAKKIKAVWLCHLANQELNHYFNINKNEIASWMTQFLNLCRDKSDLEIHVVAPNYYSNKNVVIEIENVTYHLFKYYSGLVPTIFSYLELAFRKERNIETLVPIIIDSIKPDIVHLFGSENITYSRGILPLKDKYPVLISIQGLVSWTVRKGNFLRRIIINRRIQTENEINSSFDNFTFRNKNTLSVKQFNDIFPSKHIYNLKFPTKPLSIDATKIKKEYDLVFWGRVTANKGVEDFIKAVSILSKRKTTISAIIIGKATDRYLLTLKQLAAKLDVSDKIIFAGFQKTDEDLFALASKARVYVLPTYFDSFPGSIRESMFLKIPVVSYPVGGIPEFNDRKQCLLLAKERDVNDLAEKIWVLLNDNTLYSRIVSDAYDEIQKICSNEDIYEQISKAYTDILKK